jgi:RNA polymerase sigma-70 factor (ECF subfamily)
MNGTRSSLLLRARDGDPEAWSDFTALYRPLIRAWLRRQSVADADLDDLTQDVLLCVVRNLPSFSHSGRSGAFRAWLRSIVSCRVCDFWRARPPAADSETALALLEDPESELNRLWEREHDLYVLRCLLEMVEQEFEQSTLRAFRRLALDGAAGPDVAAELGLSVGAVYVAKSRVLQRIRREADGLID